jgi:hypothetical protein
MSVNQSEQVTLYVETIWLRPLVPGDTLPRSSSLGCSREENVIVERVSQIGEIGWIIF